MHYLKHRNLARVMLISSIVVIGAFLSGYAVIGLGTVLWFTGNQEYILPFGIGAGIFIFFSILQTWFSPRCRCQLCQSPVLKSLKCSRNVNASKFLGSYRLMVATTTVFTGIFRCPYCGEQFNIWKKPELNGTPPNKTNRTRKAGSSLPPKK